MLGMLKRHEVEILLRAGHSRVSVSLRSVNRIAEEAPVVHVDDAAEREKRPISRPSLVENFRKLIVTILEEKPRSAFVGDSSASSGGRLSGRQDRTVCPGGFAAPQRSKAPGPF